MEISGTLKSITMNASPIIGEMVVAFVDEYEEPRQGPFHFLDNSYEDIFNKRNNECKVRKLGSERFNINEDQYNFTTQWEGIPTARNELSYYTLSLPRFGIPESINISDLIKTDVSYNYSLIKDELKQCYILYLPCRSRFGSFNFVLNCTFKVNEKQFLSSKVKVTNGEYIPFSGVEDLISTEQISDEVREIFRNENARQNLGDVNLMDKWNVPQFKIIPSNEASSINDDISLLIVTATPTETLTLLNYIKPLPNQSLILKTFDERQTYHVGLFGLYGVAHVQCSMGATRRDGAINTVRDAINFWHPKAVLMVGIGFGIDDKKQRLGDVLISESVAYYELARIEENRVVPRGPIVESGITLLNRAKNHLGWKYSFDNQNMVNKQVGQFLSGEKLIDSLDYKMSLMDIYPNSIGGDMEAYGVATACDAIKVEWLVIKSICDWAANKTKGFQEKAAEAAVSFSESLFSVPYSFENLNFKQLVNQNLGQSYCKVSDTEIEPKKNVSICSIFKKGNWVRIDPSANSWLQRIQENKYSKVIFEHHGNKSYFKIIPGEYICVYSKNEGVYMLGKVDFHSVLTIDQIVSHPSHKNIGFTRFELEQFNKNKNYKGDILCTGFTVIEEYKTPIERSKYSLLYSIPEPRDKYSISPFNK